MGLYEDFVKAHGGNRYLQRIASHIDFGAQTGREMQTGDPHMVPDALRLLLGTAIGLPADLGGMAGGDLAGTAVGKMAQGAPDTPENRALQIAYAMDGPGGALQAAKSDPRRSVSWGAGGLSMALDPTFAPSLLAGGAGEATNAPKALRLADLVLNKPTEKLGEALTGVVSPVARQVIDGTLGPLVKKVKPTTAREVIDSAKAQSAPVQAAIQSATAKAAPAAELLAPVAQVVPAAASPADPTALSGLGERLRLLQATYGPQWRQRLANLTGGLDYLDKGGNLIGPAGDATAILDEYLSARPTLQLAGDEAGKQGIKDRLRTTLWGDTLPAPEDVAAYREQARKDVFGLVPPQAQDQYAAIIQQMAAHPLKGGALTGAAMGGTFAQDENGDGSVDPGERLKGALEGAALGTVAGAAAKVPVGLLNDTRVIAHEAGKAGWQQALKGSKLSFRALAGDWGADKVVTPRNAIRDEIENRIKSLFAGLPQARIGAAEADIASRKRAALDAFKRATTPDEIKAAQDQAKLANMTPGLEALLRNNEIDPLTFDLHGRLGQSFHDVALGGAGKHEVLHPLASGAAGGLYSLADPTTYLTSGLGAALGVGRGVARPYTSAAFHAANDVQHLGVRNPAFEVEAQRLLDELRPQMVERLKAGGYDVSRLRPDFNATDVVNLGATDEAGVWQAVRDQIFGQGDQHGLASKFVKDTFGDYSGDPGALAGNLGKLLPFSRYALGQAPVVAKLIAQHPAVALMVANLLYKTGGKIPVPTDTPILGGLAQEELGGAPGMGSISPVSMLAPVGNNPMGAAQKLDQADNPYQAAQAILGAAGFDFNPLIQTGAYVVGADPFGPGTQSRFAGVEQAAPGPGVPTIKGVLDNVRQAVAPIDKYGASSDPVVTRLNEIVLRTTGKPLADPSNHALAVALAQDPQHPLWLQAEAEVKHGNAAKSLASGISPSTVSTTTSVKAQSTQDRAGMPYTADQIKQAATVSEQAARQMQAANDRYKAQHPAAAVNDKPALSTRETQDPRLTLWENRNSALKMVNPSVYAVQLAEFKKLAGIK